MAAFAPTNFEGCTLPLPIDLRRLANRVVSSPLCSREACGCLQGLGAMLRQRHATADFLSRPALARLAKAIGALTDENIELRTTHVRAGTYRYPPPESVNRLLVAARSELARMSGMEAVGLSGLYALMVHPYADGNGRLCRTLWLHGLLAAGFAPDQAVTAVDEFYWIGAEAVLSLIDTAQCGDAQPVLQHWLSCCTR